jgi:predicted esterase
MANDNLLTDLSITAEIDLYYDLSIPKDVVRPAPLLIAVHGYGAHKGYMMREARAVAPDNFVIASIQGPHQHYRRTDDGYRTGFGWLTDHKSDESIRLHHQFVLDLVSRLSDQGLIDRARIFLFGFSQACALNFRFAFTYPNALRGVIGVCGGIPGDLDTHPLYRAFDADTFYLYGNDDEFYTQEQFAAFDEKLGTALPNYRSKHYEAKHEITEEMREDIRQYLMASAAC